MSIVQISRIQHRTGAQSNLPQLAEGEFGFATDSQRLYIGNDTNLYAQVGGNPSNTEVLTEHSGVKFSQIVGSETDLLMTDLEDGQVLAYDVESGLYINKGGSVTKDINLGTISNVKMLGGAAGMVPTTDGSGNLTFTTKGYVANDISNIAVGSSTIVTTVNDHYMLNGSPITFSEIGGVFDTANIVVGTGSITSTLTSKNVTGVGTNFTSALIAKTLVDTSNVAIGVVDAVIDSTHLTLTTNASVAVSNSSYGYAQSDLNGNSYYAKVVTNNTFRVYTDGGLSTALNTTGDVTYHSGGRVVANVLPNTSGTGAGGTESQVQFNQGGVLAGSAGLSYSTSSSTLTATKFAGNGAAITNLSSTALTGTIPAARLTGTYAISISGNSASTSALGITNTDEVVIGAGYSGGVLRVNYRGATGAIPEYHFFNGMNTGVYAAIKALTFYGSGAGLTSIPAANLTGTINSSRLSGTYAIDISGNAATSTTATSATTAATVTSSAQANITSVGTLTSLTVAGGVTAGSFSGNGASLSSITGANVVGTVPSAITAVSAGSATTATSATSAATVTAAAQPAITSVGTLTSLGVLGAVTAGSFSGNGANLSSITGANVSGSVPLATQLANNRKINGVTFNNTSDITITDSTKVAKAGDTMTGLLTLSGLPTSNYHAVPKVYQDTAISEMLAVLRAEIATTQIVASYGTRTLSYGQTVTVSPPTGYTMSDLMSVVSSAGSTAFSCHSSYVIGANSIVFSVNSIYSTSSAVLQYQILWKKS